MRFICFLFSACLLLSCKPKAVDYSIKGKLVNGCDNGPIKNVEVQAIQMNSNNGFNESAVSDANGDFELLVSSTEKPGYRFINLQEEVPLETVDYGNIPLYSNSLIYYTIKVTNPHTAADTLWIADIANPGRYFRMLGPFHDTLIGTGNVTCINVLAYSARTKQINATNTSNTVSAWYKINRTSFYSSRSVSVQASICNAIADSLTLIVY